MEEDRICESQERTVSTLTGTFENHLKLLAEEVSNAPIHYQTNILGRVSSIYLEPRAIRG